MHIEQKIGVSGEFRIVVRRADGSVKEDTGFQENLLLANYFEALFTGKYSVGAGKVSASSMSSCFVGDGSSLPDKAQTKLDSVVALATNTTTGRLEVTEDGAPEGYVRTSETRVYIFEGIKNKNIAEVGLGAYKSHWGRPDFDYALHTRALIKDLGGSPTTITVLEGEVLEVHYRLNTFVKKEHKTGTFTLKTIVGSQETDEEYKYRLVPLIAASGDHSSFNCAFGGVEAKASLTAVGESSDFDINSAEAQAISWEGAGNSVFTGGLSDANIIDDPDRHNRNNILAVELTNTHDADSATMTYSLEVGSGLLNNVRNADNKNIGIRAIKMAYTGTGHSNYYGQGGKNCSLFLVAKSDNGDPIPKTRLNKLKFTYSQTYTRME